MIGPAEALRERDRKSLPSLLEGEIGVGLVERPDIGHPAVGAEHLLRGSRRHRNHGRHAILYLVGNRGANDPRWRLAASAACARPRCRRRPVPRSGNSSESRGRTQTAAIVPGRWSRALPSAWSLSRMSRVQKSARKCRLRHRRRGVRQLVAAATGQVQYSWSGDQTSPSRPTVSSQVSPAAKVSMFVAVEWPGTLIS